MPLTKSTRFYVSHYNLDEREGPFSKTRDVMEEIFQHLMDDYHAMYYQFKNKRMDEERARTESLARVTQKLAEIMKKSSADFGAQEILERFQNIESWFHPVPPGVRGKSVMSEIMQ